MVSLRRIYCEDSEFFRMNEVWEWLADGDDGIKINKYRAGNKENYKRKAGVVALDDKFTLSVDEVLWKNAQNGGLLENYMLAHEFAHLGHDHHAKGAVTKNFQLYDSPFGMANIPPTFEEYEANLSAVFFQCGVALLDQNVEALSLVRRAHSDFTYVKKALGMCRLDVFRDELKRQTYGVKRVVL